MVYGPVSIAIVEIERRMNMKGKAYFGNDIRAFDVLAKSTEMKCTQHTAHAVTKGLFSRQRGRYCVKRVPDQCEWFMIRHRISRYSGSNSHIRAYTHKHKFGTICPKTLASDFRQTNIEWSTHSYTRWHDGARWLVYLCMCVRMVYSMLKLLHKKLMNTSTWCGAHKTPSNHLHNVCARHLILFPWISWGTRWQFEQLWLPFSNRSLQSIRHTPLAYAVCVVCVCASARLVHFIFKCRANFAKN